MWAFAPAQRGENAMHNEAYLATWTTYQSAWSSDISARERQDILTRTVAEDCIAADPTDQCHGHAELIAKIGRSNQRFPGASFRNDTFTEHHAQALIHWTMLDGAGKAFVQGASYVRFGADGRLTHLTGFFDPAPNAVFAPTPEAD